MVCGSAHRLSQNTFRWEFCGPNNCLPFSHPLLRPLADTLSLTPSPFPPPHTAGGGRVFPSEGLKGPSSSLQSHRTVVQQIDQGARTLAGGASGGWGWPEIVNTMSLRRARGEGFCLTPCFVPHVCFTHTNVKVIWSHRILCHSVCLDLVNAYLYNNNKYIYFLLLACIGWG